HVEPQGFQPDESGRMVVAVHQVVRDLDGNLMVDQMVHHMYTFADGLIERMDIQEA
ncbi:MAG TPA: ketosteroid isomerase, partial [Cyanobacteria bacterium UBA8543]|nr:ketosteroid isomerase [Cyanobacteria bacterium UBA8543]